MEYLDFELRIDGDGDGAYSLEVRSPAGETSDRLDLSLAQPELRRGLLAVEQVRSASTAQRSLVPRKDDAQAGEMARKLGQELFEALMNDKAVYGCYRTSLDRARRENKGLRLRLRINASDLAVLPWEFLYDPELIRGHLCLSKETPVIRHLELQLPADPLTLEPPIRILGMIGARHGLDADGERRQMEAAVEHLVEKGTLTLTWLPGHGWRDLIEALRHGPWHVFHFIGHGGFDPETGEGLILLEDDGDGAAGEQPSHRLTAGALADLLADHRSLRLVVLNSCEGARASRTELLSSTGSVLASRGIPAVVSMQYEITDRAALELSRTFYEALTEGMPVDAALSEARKAIRMAAETSAEWGTPVLHMRCRNGLLFHVDLAGAIFRHPPASRTAPPAPRVAAIEKPSATAAADAGKGLRILLRRVRAYWIAGVLERSLHQAARLELGMEMMEGAVESPWGSLLETPGAGSEPLPPGRTLGQVLDEVGGSLLVLGEPGSGKTTTLLELARDLLKGAEADPARPLPVVFNLSSWGGAGRDLAAWMVDELAAKYLIPKKVGHAWLAESRILPLLDGLDEVGAEQRSACVGTVNDFAEEALVGVVVCCRLKEYLELPVRLSLNGAIRLQPLSREQVLAYVSEAGARLAALKRLLERDSGMLIEARSPLMLSLMMQAYRDLPVEDPANAGMETAAARRKQLMDAYVAARFRRARTGTYHA